MSEIVLMTAAAGNGSSGSNNHRSGGGGRRRRNKHRNARGDQGGPGTANAQSRAAPQAKGSGQTGRQTTPAGNTPELRPKQVQTHTHQTNQANQTRVHQHVKPKASPQKPPVRATGKPEVTIAIDTRLKPEPADFKPEPFRHVTQRYGVSFYDTVAAAKADADTIRKKTADVDQLNLVIRAEGALDDPELNALAKVKVFSGAAWTLIHERRVADGWYNEPQ